MHPALRFMIGFLFAPIAMAAFVVLISGLYTRLQLPGMFLPVLAIAYPTAIIFGAPSVWLLKKWRRERIQHFFIAGIALGVVPAVLLFALVVDPILSLASIAGSAVGASVFWAIAVRGQLMQGGA